MTEEKSNIYCKVRGFFLKVAADQRYGLIFLFFATIIFRIVLLLNQEISADETTYCIIGRAIFNGKIYLVDMWDFKPIGIFLIFGLIQHYIFDSILTIRIIGMFIIFFSAALVYKIKLKLSESHKKAFFSGLLYILLLTFTHPSFDLNTEVFFNLFTLLGFLLLTYQKPVYLFFSGLLLGIGFMIKYVVAFDAFVLYMFFIFGLFTYKSFKIDSKNITFSLLAIFGFILPFALTNIYYLVIDAYPEFYKATFLTSKIYGSRINIRRELLYFWDFNLNILPIVILFYLSLFNLLKKRSGKIPIMGVFVLSWFLVDWIPVILQGKHFAHYFIQIFIPVSIFAIDGFDKIKKNTLKLSLLILFIVYIGNSFYKQWNVIINSGEEFKEVVSFLKPKLKKEDLIYTNVQSLYYYLDKTPPSRIIHQSIFTNKSHILAAGINSKEEIKIIFKRKPSYLVIKGEIPDSLFEKILKHDYQFMKKLEKDYTILKRKENLE